jgi:OmpA-OmpF porin, OOP family
MKSPIVPFILAAVTAVGTSPLLAQDTTTPVRTEIQTVRPLSGASGFRTWSIGLNGGAVAPIVATGGTNDFTAWKINAGYGGYISYQATHAMSAELEYLGGTLSGNNSKLKEDGTAQGGPYSAFSTKLQWAGTLSAVYSITNVNWLSRRNVVIPFVSVGAGMAGYSPTLTLTNGSTAPYKPSDNNLHALVIPIGAGLKFNVSPGINIDLGYRMYFLDDDDLDGVERVPGHKDKFSYGYAGIQFAIGKKSKPQLLVDNPVYDMHKAMKEDNEELRERLTEEADSARQQMMEKMAQASQIALLQAQLDRLKSDSDGDGVSDYFDKCPGTPAGTKVDGSGCPLPQSTIIQKFQVTEEDRRVIREAIQNLEFETGSDRILSTSYPSLNKVADILINKHFSLKLAGHTDNVGTSDHNMELSKARAEAVKAYLVTVGANPSRIEATGYGQTQPIATNKTPEGRQKNRRVEFTLY